MSNVERRRTALRPASSSLLGNREREKVAGARDSRRIRILVRVRVREKNRKRFRIGDLMGIVESEWDRREERKLIGDIIWRVHCLRTGGVVLVDGKVKDRDDQEGKGTVWFPRKCLPGKFVILVFFLFFLFGEYFLFLF